MKIAITGAGGQLGTSLRKVLGREHEVVPLKLPEFNLLSHPGEAVRNAGLDVCIHTAAMTDVDGCAKDPERAMQSNGWATGDLAQACAEEKVRMVYISTNEVFSGNGNKTWYEYDAVGPINEYGRSKLAGEELAKASGADLCIIRLSWVFAAGFANFPRKICDAARQADSLSVVSDEVACPSYAPDAADAVAKLIEQPENGTFHLCNEGAVSRYDFARYILHLTGQHTALEPIPQSSYQRASQPPLFTPLGNETAASLGIRLRDWQDAAKDWVDREQITT